jgi:hypothetical protein
VAEARAVVVELVDIVSDQVDFVGIQDRMIIMVLHLAHLLTSIHLINMALRLLLAHLITTGPIATRPLGHLLTTITGKFPRQK